MSNKSPLRPATTPLALCLALAAAGACGEPPSQDQSTEESLAISAGEANEPTQEQPYAPDEVRAAGTAAPACIGMRNGSIKRTKLPGQWTGIIDNACNKSMRVNLDIAANKDPGCRTYAAKTSHNTKWWAGLGTSGYRGLYECD